MKGGYWIMIFNDKLEDDDEYPGETDVPVYGA